MSKFMKLSRVEMKNVLGGLCMPGNPNCGDGGGGSSPCYLTVYNGPGYTNPQRLPTDATNSTDAEARCVALILEPGLGVYNCKFNCSGGTANPS